MLVDKQIPSLVSGVSQQPATVRLPSQAEAITNAWLSVVDGAQTRNPSEHIVKITSDDLSGAYLHTINRDTTERYLVVLDGVRVRVFDLAGNEKTVTTDIGGTLEEYFAASGAGITIGTHFATKDQVDTDAGDFRAAKGSPLIESGTGNADYFRKTGAASLLYVGTVIGPLSNSLPQVDLSVQYADLADFLSNNPAITVGTTFQVADLPSPQDFVDGALAAEKTQAMVVKDIYYVESSTVIRFTHNPNGSTRSPTPTTIYDGSGGYNYLVSANPTQDFVCVTVADYTFILNRDVIVRLGPPDGQIGSSTRVQNPKRWTMVPRYPGEASDDPVRTSLGGFTGQRARQVQYTGNATASGITGTVQTFQDLPTGATSGDIYKVEGAADSGFATYYVRSAGNNVWNETVAPGLRNRIKGSTMPHALVRNSDGTFTFGQYSWADRRMGDETTNPNPAFVGREIRDIFWYKNRFGCAVDEGIVLTRVGDFGNFYRMTVVDLLADDRVDIQASETKVTKINYAVPFDDSIVLFSDQTQLRLSHGSEGLTPSNASLDVATNFVMIPNVRPFALGSDVYFAAENGTFAAIREYFVAPDSQANDAANVTGHVPRYVPSSILRLSGSDTENFLLVLTEHEAATPQELFVYKFHWINETEKAQSAWAKWTFSNENTFLAAEVLDNDIYVLSQRSDGAHLEKITLRPDATPTGMDFQVYLDRRTNVSAPTYDAMGDHSTWTLPYTVAVAARDNFMLVRDDGEAEPGTLITGDPANFSWPTSNEVRITGDFTGVGVYAGVMYEYRYEFSEQFARNAQEVPMLNGKLLLRNWTVYFIGTAFFEVEASPYGAAVTPEPVIPALVAQGQALTQGLAYFETEIPVSVDGQHSFGVYGESTDATVAIVSTSPYGVTLTQAEYEAFFHKRSRTI